MLTRARLAAVVALVVTVAIIIAVISLSLSK